MHIKDIKVNDDRKSTTFEFEHFLGDIPPWNDTFCFIVMVQLSGTVFQILRILKSIMAAKRRF